MAGNYDPESGLFVVGVFSLDPEPLIFVLVAGQGDPPSSSARQAAALTTRDGREFYVRCGEAGFTWEDTDVCRQSKPVVAAEFVKAYDEFRPIVTPDTGETGDEPGDTGGDADDTGGETGDTGGETGDTGGETGDTGGETGDTGGDAAENFPLPSLKKWTFGFLRVGGPVANWSGTLGPIFMVRNDIPPCNNLDSSDDELGHYSYKDQSIILCIDFQSGSLEPDPPDPQVPQLEPRVVQTIRHELFHAFQHAYPAVQGVEDLEDEWTIEGTATAVQNPDAVLTRAQTWDLRRIDVPLFLIDDDERYEYQAQDFWIYFGRTRGLKYHYLKELLEQGGDPIGANLFFAGSHETLLGLAYWDWVKNQAMEKSFDFDGQLLQPCHIEAQVIGTPQILRYPPIDAAPEVEGTLDTLTSAVVKIEFGRATGPVTVEADPADNLKYKIYLEGEDDLIDGRPSCVWELDDASRTFEEAPSEPVYVLLSNVLHHPGSHVRYKVRVEPGAGGRQGDSG